MEYALSGLVFAGILSLLRWGFDMDWLFAITAATAWATAVWSYTVLLKDQQFRRAQVKGAHWQVLNLILLSAIGLGLAYLEVGPKVRAALSVMILGAAGAGARLGMLYGRSAAAASEKEQRTLSR